MSRDIGMQAMRLASPERLAHTEYCSDYALVRAVTGLDPAVDGSAWRAFNDAWDLDFLWVTNDGPVGWADRGRVTDMGHAEFLEGGVDRREPVKSPFTNVEQVLEFDAVAEYGLPDFGELVAYYDRCQRDGSAANPGQVVTGGYYQTVISGAIAAFGWDMLLEAAAQKDRFARVLATFAELTLHHVRAWAKTSIDVFIQHDDFVWTAGPFLHPSFYRSAIIPHYKRFWDVLHEAGKTVLFCSDGTFTPFIDDIAQAGADGFIFEPSTDLDAIVERYGKTKVIMGSKVDCRTLTFGTPDDIRAEIDATLAIAKGCPDSCLPWETTFPATYRSTTPSATLTICAPTGDGSRSPAHPRAAPRRRVCRETAARWMTGRRGMPVGRRRPVRRRAAPRVRAARSPSCRTSRSTFRR